MKILIQNDNIPNETFINEFMVISEKNGIPKDYISTEGYSEDRICLEEDNGKLLVYYAYRNSKKDLKEYDNIDIALLDVAERCTESEEQYRNIASEYTEKVNQCRYVGILY